ncbi:DUF72 domain-containing protein [Desulfoferrobacter suflitae]|uniref:DUF72 domain-containing protein n=1 Tax=Desulfoferrobacter suflitae TaxID=2865782 RepID=UPI002164AFA2|nr:DUF72 domain-containing protein [Desulfoferrobacter suflitae]MCK8600116.1 DUF72 domain-containing protein [Desulfoferrobacter suflitae]
MAQRDDIERYRFRNLHPNVLIGTASDRYWGWLGQIYTPEKYQGRITKRTNKVGGKTFPEEVLPVDSVKEYFEHFGVLEIDYTFYRPLLDEKGEPTQTHRVLAAYREYIRDRDSVVLKVPQLVFAQKLKRGNRFVENDSYLDPDVFTRQFYRPAVKILGKSMAGLIFEQEYQRKDERISAKEMGMQLDAFFSKIPKDTRYHIELRTASYLDRAVFEVFAKHGVGQVLSHWTWLPPLRRQFAKAGRRFFNSGKQAIVRLMTPRDVRYEDAYAKAHPFDKIVDGMLSREMIEDTAVLMHAAVKRDVRMNVIINNRAGGNAPMIAQRIAGSFIAKR